MGVISALDFSHRIFLFTIAAIALLSASHNVHFARYPKKKSASGLDVSHDVWWYSLMCVTGSLWDSPGRAIALRLLRLAASPPSPHSALGERLSAMPDEAGGEMRIANGAGNDHDGIFFPSLRSVPAGINHQPFENAGPVIALYSSDAERRDLKPIIAV